MKPSRWLFQKDVFWNYSHGTEFSSVLETLHWSYPMSFLSYEEGMLEKLKKTIMKCLKENHSKLYNKIRWSRNNQKQN